MQEKSPKILHYTGNIEEDKKILLETYESLDIIVKKVIKKYAEEDNPILYQKYASIEKNKFLDERIAEIFTYNKNTENNKRKFYEKIYKKCGSGVQNKAPGDMRK